MKQNGFTLIELMITIVIIAILAGIAVPQYLAYTKRAEVAELVALADIVKKKVGIFYSTKGRWPGGICGVSACDDSEEDVGLDKVLGRFGVSADGEGLSGSWNTPRMSARWHALDLSIRLEGPGTSYILIYTPVITNAALTWSCLWYGEDDYPGAKPDGCE